MLKRLGDVEAKREGCRAAWARTTDGAATGTLTMAMEEESSEDFASSVRELPGKGAGVGLDWFVEH